jgi:hypothetical protein
MEILSDHGESGNGSNNTVCRHSVIGSTIASAVFYPSPGRILYCHTSPCQKRFKSYKIKER